MQHDHVGQQMSRSAASLPAFPALPRRSRRQVTGRLEMATNMSALSSQLTTGSNKRKASATFMGPPKKKPKRPTALESKLENLQTAIAGFQPIWKEYAPDTFTEEMYYMRDQIAALTPDTIGTFIETSACEDALLSLDHLPDILLGKTTSIGSQPPERTNSHQRMHSAMLAYVGRVRECLNALVAQARVKPPPCEFADSNIWGVYQEKANPILCLRPAAKRGLPIPLMHKAFCDFARDFRQPCLDEQTEEYLAVANKLCQEMPSAFKTELARRKAFEKIFVSLDNSLIPIPEYSISEDVSDLNVKESGAKLIWHGMGTLVLMLEEFKNADGDAYMQICRVYEDLCADPEVKRLVEFGNPVFLLCIHGPYLMVCGAVIRKNVHVEPLTTFIPMFPEYGIEGRQGQLAHCLRALKQGLDALRKFWQDVGVTSGADEKLTIDKTPKQHPDCPDNGLLRFDDWEGIFESPMDNKRNSGKPPCFLATLRKGDVKVSVVVKFVYSYTGTYGKATHEYLHGLGLAPQLYSAVNLHRGLVMVIMEHLAFQKGIGGWVELETFEKRLGTMAGAVRKKLDKIIDLLQDQNMVHADLRPKNIMVQVDKHHQITMSETEPALSLVDFDWAGTVDEVSYPPCLNRQIPWPTAAKGFKKVGGNDDRILLDNWWKAFVEPTEIS